MARTGLYKSEVKKARDSLIVQGKNPSVDAVRIALGNTGSKTTIHKYLKELEEEYGGGDTRKTSISEALQDLVARLAVQLQDEANLRVDEIQAQSAEKDRQHTEALTALKQEIVALSTQLQQAATITLQEKTSHDFTAKELQSEKIARHTLEQHVADLKERLVENEMHLQSIEEKHQHARDALEHYRQSVKDQREQDQRRHEQQIQQMQAEMRQLQQSLIVKQDDLTRLNKEGARLVADLSHTQKSLYDQQTHGRQLAQKLEALQAVEQHGKTIEARLADKEIQVQTLKGQLDVLIAKEDFLSGQVRDLELALATTNAKLAAQQGVVAELHTYLETREQSAEEKSS